VKCSQSLGKDLPVVDNQRTEKIVSDIFQLVDAYHKEDWSKGGDIIIEAGVSIDTEKILEKEEDYKDYIEQDEDKGKLIVKFNMENNQHKPQNVNQPLVIRSRTIGGATIKGSGGLEFSDVRNLWLYGINFEYDPPGKGEDHFIVSFEKAGNCRIARCDFRTEFADEEAVTKTRNEHYYLSISSGRENDEGKNLIDHNIFHHKPKSHGSFYALAIRSQKIM
jgi:hypothetical protein